jgi:dTMP kinase
MKTGKFIVFEGIEGTGKSTQARLLFSYFKKKRKQVLLTYEPGATKLGKQLRQILLSPSSNVVKEAEIFLFAADRIQHLKEAVLPALKKGKIVISDRYQDSTFAYQVGGRNLNEQLVKSINDVSNSGLNPDLIFFLDVPVSVGIGRIQRKPNSSLDRFEKEKFSFHERVRKFYLKSLRNNKKAVIIDGEQDKNEIHKKIVEEVERRFYSVERRAFSEKMIFSRR